MVKPRFYPSRDQSSPVRSSRPLGFGQVLSNQPAASRLEHLQVPVIFKDSVVAGGRTVWGIFGHIGRSPSCDVGTTGPMPYRPDYYRPLGFGQVLSNQPAASRLEHLQVPVIFKDSVVAGGRTVWGIFGHIGRSPSCDVGTTGRALASGSPLEGTPVPRIPARRNPRFPAMEFSGSGPRIAPFPGKWKTSDKENLPYFRIWKSLTYSNRLRPALGRLYKGDLNPKARDRHFET
ncbi:hypothetical protein F2Q68_00039220 [Brassica cretica]|uniref:Uncharacterized protein n=2 Tax=Brassica cretica TaxID=69181 RepID=A0A8S9MJ68_BRACR|nr:hypothetical protein F2Q68_00039220 [Brassica cretica]